METSPPGLFVTEERRYGGCSQTSPQMQTGDFSSQNRYNSVDSLIHSRAITTQHLGRSQYRDLHERRNTLPCPSLTLQMHLQPLLVLLIPHIYFLEVKSVSRFDEPLFSERLQVQASSDRLPHAQAEEGSLFSVTALSQAGEC
jgi:hypothetical protein